MARLAARAPLAQRERAHRRGAAVVTAAPCKRCKDSRIVFNDEGQIAPCTVCATPAKRRTRARPIAMRRHWSDNPPHSSHVLDADGYCRGCMGHRSWQLVRDPCSIRYRPPMGSLAPKAGDEDE